MGERPVFARKTYDGYTIYLEACECDDGKSREVGGMCFKCDGAVLTDRERLYLKAIGAA